MRTTIITLAGAMPSSVTITLDVLTYANRLCTQAGRPAPFELRLFGSGAADFAPFVEQAADSSLPPELVLVPAQGLSKAPSLAKRLQDPDVEDARREIIRGADAGADIASSCTGTLLLASTGLLDERRATTAWWLAPLCRELFPRVRLDTRELVLADRRFTTAGAAMAQMDLMVLIVARHAGSAIADRCARIMVLDERRSQAPYMAIGLLAAGDEKVARAAAWARAALEGGTSVNEIAAAVGVSPRTFARRVQRSTGLSPVRFLQRVRLERAVELIETTRLPVEEVARQVGYAEPSTLRGLIRRTYGAGPRELRSRSARGR
ncbi:GlxA family transcriptional regulator [Sphingosinicella sp. BN140058]|uniref:GlxA family transcriptional regulator n=1 Tax=Sphingosinicella sp. BN140058 TaxID=1892855 RepID=UPI0013EAAE35|nr:helix-turn-helix domain-containing protein [Sphingosinicella sp. BN140058]